MHDSVTLDTALARTPCPHCGHARLERVLRCDLGGSACLTVARCDRCRTHYEVTPGSDRDAAAALRCDPAGRTCA